MTNSQQLLATFFQGSPSHGGGSHGRLASEHHADTGVLEAHGQDAFVDLVELHQLQEVNEERQAVVYGEVLPTSVFALRRGDEEGQRKTSLTGGVLAARRALTGITR